MIKVSTPGKVVLFGEHAVVYGEPAIALAIDLTIELEAELSKSSQTLIDGEKPTEHKHKFLIKAMEHVGCPGPLDIKTVSHIPPSAGLGSSAAITNVTVGMCHAFKNTFTQENIAKDGFEVEYSVLGRASPMDTSTTAHGSAVLLAKEKKENFLWKIEKADKVWYIHHIDVPEISLVIGNTGLKGDTKSEVNKVYRFYEKSAFAKDVIKEIGQLTLEGAHALKKKDIVKIGELMDRNQKLLTILGVSTSELEKLINASKPYSYGAKLTGAGGGGCMLALTDKPDIVAKKIREKGGEPYIVKIETKGTHLVSK